MRNSQARIRSRTGCPHPQALFSLYIRAYWGKQPILYGSWKPPVVKAVENSVRHARKGYLASLPLRSCQMLYLTTTEIYTQETM